MNTLEQKQQRLESILQLAPVVAVVVVDDVRAAVALARALVAGGIKAIEVTLRTATALEAIRAIAGEVEGAQAGAGTVLTPTDLASAENAGASFAVSPGATSALIAAAKDSALPYLPGAATPSESLRLFEFGYRLQKFFPAESAGGVNYLRSLAGPLPQIRFCPTGGISVGNAGTYLSLSNVICVGGSWLASADILRAQDWTKVESLARAAAHLRSALTSRRDAGLLAASSRWRGRSADYQLRTETGRDGGAIAGSIGVVFQFRNQQQGRMPRNVFGCLLCGRQCRPGLFRERTVFETGNG